MRSWICTGNCVRDSRDGVLPRKAGCLSGGYFRDAVPGKWGSTRNAGDARAVESSAGAHSGDRIRSGFKNFAGEKTIGDTAEAGRAGGSLHRRNRRYPVAEEAAKTAEFFGCRVERYYDIGVAGIHRLLSKREAIAQANCVIAVAGMEGALGTVSPAGGKSGHCGSDLGRLWCKFSWTVGVDHDDQFLCERHFGCKYR